MCRFTNVMQSGTMHVHPHPQDSQMLWDKYGRMQRKDGDWIRSLHPYVGARGLSRHICRMIILMSNLFVLCLNMCMYYILICVMISRKMQRDLNLLCLSLDGGMREGRAVKFRVVRRIGPARETTAHRQMRPDKIGSSVWLEGTSNVPLHTS